MDVGTRKELDRLMARLADGDREPLARVLVLLRAPIRAFTGRLLVVDADADDAAQRVLIAVFARAHEFEPGRDALTWAFGIAAWEARTILRRQQRRRDDAMLVDGRDDAPSPEQHAIDRRMFAALEHALGVLSPRDRAALGLEDDGDDTGAATRRKRRQRALVRLRRAWSKLYGTQ